VEVLFYETSECAIVHFVIPNLAREEVRTASLAIKKVIPLLLGLTTHSSPQAIQQICNQDFRNIAASIPVLLDAPRYLYVSTNVSLKFPNLLESAIIQSYHTYYPSDAPWSQSISSPSSNGWWWMSNTRSRMGKSVITSTLQYLGATSPTVQRVMIHLIQPLLVSSIVYLWVTLYSRPIWFTLIGFLFLVFVIRHCYLQRYHATNSFSNESEVHPVNGSTSASDAGALKRTNSGGARGVDLPTPKSTNTNNTNNSSELIAQIGVANLCDEEKSDPDSSSRGGGSIFAALEPEKMSIDDSSVESSACREELSYSSDYNTQGKCRPSPLRRKPSDYSLSGSCLSSLESAMEFSDPEYNSASEEEDADSFE
jgi:hypothetical protein